MSHVERYQAAVLAVHVTFGLLRKHDFRALLAAIERAEALGPLVDPTLYRDSHVAMAEDARALRCALSFVTACEKAGLGGEPR